MPTKISADNLQSSLLNVIVAGGGPKITSIAVANSSYTILDDTAVDTAGGYIVITGTGFATGCQVIINDVVATSTTFVNSTTVRAQIGPRAAGTYNVYLTNPDGGTAIRISGVTYSALPGWVTSSTLAPGESDTFISYNLNATDATSYTLQVGSTLPPGITLSANGYLAGTVTGITDNTVYSFTIVAIDAEAQDSPRTFSVTISTGDLYINYVTALLSGDNLTANANTFLTDASTNNFTATPVNDTKPNRFSPFTPGYYSNFFDGSGDNLLTPYNAALNLTGDFTIECWFWATAYGGMILNMGGGSGIAWASYELVNNTDGINFAGSSANSGYDIGSESGATGRIGTILLNTWNHLAVTRSGNVYRGFVNGVQGYTQTLALTPYNTSTRGLSIGGNYTNTWGSGTPTSNVSGYISNLRIVKGTPIYTANFTPPTSPLTAVTNTSLLTCRSNRFNDVSTNNIALTRTGDVSVRSFDPFVLPSEYENLGSTYFDGSGDYASIPDNVALRPATSDFTIEFWAYHNSVGGNQVYVGKGGIGTGAWLVEKNQIQAWGFQVSGGSTIQTSQIAGSYVGVWFHIAVTRSGSTLRFFLDGTLMDTRTVSTDLSNAAELQIGTSTQLNWPFNGWMSNLRIVKGTALYTSAFTPPTTPLTAVTNTTLLTFQNNQPINNNVFVDKSSHNNVVARIGNPTQGTFSPYGENWSHYFPSSGTGLSFTNTNNQITFGTGNFTMEFWVNFDNPTSTNTYNVVLRNYNTDPFTTDYFYLGKHASATVPGAMSFWVANFAGSLMLSDPSLPSAGWNHFAIVRNGNTWTMYRNGTAVHSVTSSISMGTRNNNLCQIGVEMAGYLSNFRVVRGTAVYTANFTPSTTPLLPAANTSLLTCNEYNFADYSPNRFAITRVGDVAVQKLSPFTTTLLSTPYYGTYFDGAGDILTVPSNAALAFGTGDFTIETWYYTTVTPTSSFVCLYNTGNNNFFLQLRDTSFGIGQVNVAEDNSFSFNFAPNQWYHLAVSRSGTTVRGFVNGTLVSSGTNSVSYGQSGATIGGLTSSLQLVTGYISNLRVVKGTAVYTSTFTPSTTPLTAVANTSLLTCRSNTNIDLSNNNFAITVSGNSIPTVFSPFTPTYTNKQTYSTSTFGGSMFFDGTGDYLTIGNNLNVGANNFTVQAWVHPTAWTVEWNSIISTRPTASTGGFSNVFVLGVHNSGYPYIYSGDFQVTGTANTVPLRSWTHLCVTRSGSTMRLFVNGALANSTTSLQNYTTASGAVGSNGNGSEQWTGYLSDVTLTGGEAIYTSSFVPPLILLAPANNTLLMLSGTDAAIIDSSMKNDIETVGDVRLNTSVIKYGNSSIFFDGTNDSLKLPAPANVAFASTFRTGNFTIECWVNRTTSGSVTHFLDFRGPNNNDSNPVFYWQTNNFIYYTNNNSSGDNQIQTSNPITSSSGWVHLALVRSGSTLTVYVNGTASGSVTYSTNVLGGNPVTIGNRYTDSGAFAGYIDDFRITNGIARYTANFTPPGKLPLK
jgi:hypothetical protein